MPQQQLILSNNLCPGDVLTMTTAIESLHETYPGEFITDVRTKCAAIWEHNPHITRLQPRGEIRAIEMHYPTIHQSNQKPVSFITGYTRFLGETLGLFLEPIVNRPVLYLSKEEPKFVDQVMQYGTGGRRVPFWIINAGVKNDYTIKQWPVEYYQEVIDATRGIIQWVQIGSKEHHHPDLRSVHDLRSKTSTRELIRLAYHCEGGLGPVTFLQHLCAAWEKPYICLLGGREPATWVQYPLQHTLHTIGLLPCCKTKACFKARVVKLRDSDEKNENLCEMPVIGMERPVAKCMAIIRPEEVINILRRVA